MRCTPRDPPVRRATPPRTLHTGVGSEGLAPMNSLALASGHPHRRVTTYEVVDPRPPRVRMLGR